ncbi:import motor complex subunit PAM16 [Cyberlindnera jadinii NRRL Y-1542]|uniref:Mitochondrial import inner membrane translocase subunit TIM16 n=1 Tax=Cyberlindnera jadinii (strain ATCC 18201 / CBS 1600 / BCRC 20928 / JCM 3617 / NBRC 0987 / NRRL Y-1542) TaxID=983966 RepID=A0A1E4S968_CYBJN|nr:protein transporter [Cyberlindnera jadinii NRRL Y-1542]ODV75922.1 protein transporter [Cyberlindnera jadinii NRRL Y-1542]
MAHRLIVQVLFTGAKVFGTAFTTAYRQAATQTAKQSATQANRARDTGITLDESAKILDVDLKNTTLEQVEERYQKMFDINSKEKADSFYLQSKIYWAAERLKSEFKAQEAERAAGEGGEGKDAASSEAPPKQ